MNLPSTIFREYDIRGIVGDTLTEEAAYAIGRAFGSKVVEEVKNPNAIAVGWDGRLSSPMLAEALMKGLRESGNNVLAIGCGPTPMLYYTVCTEHTAAGIMITGSHNPPSHNGFKFMLGTKPFYGQDIRDLHTRIAQQRFTTCQGEQRSKDMREAYVDTLARAYVGKRPLKVAWDAGNGAAGEIMARLCAKLPGEHILLNEKIDGTFPAHHPDPAEPENLEQLIHTVRERGCDLGIAFDGDGDRIGAVDGEGNILWGDQMLALYAADVLRELPGATIIADVKASQTLFDTIAHLGGGPLMWKTGHSHIKAKMQETGAPLAGEMSGHMFFADRYFGFDDGIYAAVRLLSLVASQGESLATLAGRLPKMVATPEIRFACDDTRKFAVIDEVKARLHAEKTPFFEVDGLRVSTPEGWWLLRASNTQAVLVARAEGQNQAVLDTLIQDLRKQLALSNVALPK